MGQISNETNSWGNLKNGLESKLFEPIKIGAWNLHSRIVMAPLTRTFADDQTGVVGEDIVEYY